MPDAAGNIVPTFYSLSAERWEAIFGSVEKECGCASVLDCDNSEGCVKA